MAEDITNPAAQGSGPGEGALADGKVNALNVLKFAGAFVAFMIGSGYASGQEIMQFFTSYGLWSIGGLIIALILFSWLGKVLMNYGYRHRDLTPEQMPDQSFRYYAGKYFGTFLAWFIPCFLVLVCIVMTSGAGATLAQYFGLPTWVGSLGMCILVFVTNLFGFNKLVDIIGALGPLTIIFSIIIAVYAIAQNPGGLAEYAARADIYEQMAHATTDGSWWALAGLLYVCYNMTGSVPFLTQTGATANSAKEAKFGALFGGILFIVAGILMNIALICNLELTTADGTYLYASEVPTLILSELIGPVMSIIFAIILLDEIFSTAAPMMWTAVNRFAPEGTSKNRIVLAIFNVLVLLVVLSPLSYGQLLGIIYPYTGYIGIAFLICVVVRQCIEAYNKKNGRDLEAPLFFKKD